MDKFQHHHWTVYKLHSAKLFFHFKALRLFYFIETYFNYTFDPINPVINFDSILSSWHKNGVNLNG
jgi:hypothetical protein